MEERLREIIHLPEWKSILLELVEKNEIDPWNVDIIRLTSLYIEEIQRRKELDLYIPANAVLASSILLWLKSRTLREIKEELEKDQEDETEEGAFDVNVVFSPEEPEPLPTEEPVSVVPPTRLIQRKITLDELLDVMERLMKKGNRRKIAEVLPEVEDFFEEMSEGEDVENYIEEVKRKILATLDSTNMTLLSAISPEEPIGFVKTFLAVLYLANEGFLELYQEEVFGDVIIKVIGDVKRS